MRFDRLLQPLKLLAPALIPSWNFFDVIAPSPRVEYALLATPAAPGDWREFRPRPARVSPLAMACRLFWNPVWNESLFLVSCAERLTSDASSDDTARHSEDEIFKRIAADLSPEETANAPWLNFQLVFLSRQGDAIEREILYRPAPRKLADLR